MFLLFVYRSKTITNVFCTVAAKRSGHVETDRGVLFCYYVFDDFVVAAAVLYGGDYLHSWRQLGVSWVVTRLRVDDLSFFDSLSPFCFLLIEFHCTFSYLIKDYNILFIIITFWLGCDSPSGLFFVPALLISILTPLFLPSSLFLYLISFLPFPCASVWENTRALVPYFQ